MNVAVSIRWMLSRWVFSLSVLSISCMVQASGTEPVCQYDEVGEALRPISWREHGQGWARDVQEQISSRIELLRQLKRAGDPRVAILEQLGVRWESDTVRFPDLETFLRHYDRVLNRLVEQGLIREDESIRPGRVFQDATGEYHFVGVSDRIDPNWREVDMTTVPENVIGTMIARGYFPISAGRGFHDSFHLVGFLQTPRYMAAVRRMAQAFQQETSTETRANRRHRLFFVLEALATVPPANRNRLLQILGGPFRQDSRRVWTVDEVRERLLSTYQRDRALLQAQGRTLLREIPELVVRHGGAVAEPGAQYYDLSLGESLNSLAVRLRSVVNDSESSADEIAGRLADLQVMLYESSRVDVETLIDSMLPQSVPNTAPAYQMFIRSRGTRGYWSRGQSLYQSLERPMRY